MDGCNYTLGEEAYELVMRGSDAVLTGDSRSFLGRCVLVRAIIRVRFGLHIWRNKFYNGQNFIILDIEWTKYLKIKFQTFENVETFKKYLKPLK